MTLRETRLDVEGQIIEHRQHFAMPTIERERITVMNPLTENMRLSRIELRRPFVCEVFCDLGHSRMAGLDPAEAGAAIREWAEQR